MENEIIILQEKLNFIIIFVAIISIFNTLLLIFNTVNSDKFRTMFVKIFYKVTNIFKLFPKKKRNVVFINGHSNLFNGNIRMIYNELNKEDLNLNLIRYTKNDILDKSNKSLKNILKNIKKMYTIFTASTIIVNDYIPLFAKIRVRKSTQLVQVWHAGGAFKKFGIDSLQNINNEEKMRNCIACHSQYTKVIVSSSDVVDIYAHSLNVDKSRVLPLGLARADKFYDIKGNEIIKSEFINRYPNLKNKKIIVYAPTFRDDERKNFKLQLDLEYLYNNLSDEYVIITKMHPFIKNGVKIPFEFSDRIFDLSFEDIDDLMISSDILITDYSSMIFEYAILEKPIIFYAYDLALYNNSLRGFYYDYATFVPGPIVYTTYQIVDAIKKDDWNMEKIKSFKKKFNEYNDGKATNRIAESILKDK